MNKKYKNIINNIKIGDYVTFKHKFLDIDISGEVKYFYFIKNEFYVVIYSFFKREEITYILDKNLKLKNPNNKEPDNSPIIYPDLIDDEKYNNKYSTKIKFVLAKIIIIIILISTISFFIPLNNIVVSRPKYEYEDFLAKSFNFYKLYYVVTKRITYTSDKYDDWITPKNAWDSKSGDCEELASVISAYLSNHGIENYLVGLQIEGKNVGHAVVFLKQNNIFYIIDPTDAVERYGIQKIKNVSNIDEAVKKYTNKSAAIYKIPTYNGEKEIIRIIR